MELSQLNDPLCWERLSPTVSTVTGFQWASIVLSFVGAVLAAYSTASVPVALARSMPTFWGSLVPAKIVLEQKAYSAGTLWAISSAFLFQMLAMVSPTSRSGTIILVAGIVLASGVAVVTKRRRDALVLGYLKWVAQQKNPQGELVDIERVRSAPEQFAEQIGLFYDLPRKRSEQLDAFKQRLERRIRDLART